MAPDASATRASPPSVDEDVGLSSVNSTGHVRPSRVLSPHPVTDRPFLVRPLVSERLHSSAGGNETERHLDEFYGALHLQEYPDDLALFLRVLGGEVAEPKPPGRPGPAASRTSPGPSSPTSRPATRP